MGPQPEALLIYMLATLIKKVVRIGARWRNEWCAVELGGETSGEVEKEWCNWWC